MNIGQYWDAVFEIDRHRIDVPRWADMYSDDWPIDSVCGVVARRMIDKAADLCLVMREETHRIEVLNSVQDDILMVCFG